MMFPVCLKRELISIFLTACLAALTFSGCSPISLHEEKNIQGFNLSNDHEAWEIGNSNKEILKKKYGKEWCLNRSAKDAPPLWGIALSGGGMRSAAFNIGILSGLHQINKLKDIDIMSSVSGGSYAMSWYYLQKYYTGKEDSELFENLNSNIYQGHLLEHGRIGTHSDQAFLEYPEMTTKTLSNVLAIPFHWFANGLFDWNLNLSPYRKYYQNALEREFHVTPTSSNGETMNSKSSLGVLVGVKKDKRVEFENVREYLKENDLPSFVINTTAKIDDDDLEYRSGKFSNTIFEFTPFSYGSDSFGYQYDNFPMDVHTAVATSGAAFDSSRMPGEWAWLSNVLNLNLGYWIRNPNVKQSKVVKHNLLPFPFYLFYRGKNDLRGTSIYLTDGGHSDNLGAFSLIRRMCKNILIIDAEYDPEYGFDAYYRLKRKLKSEFNINITIDGIDSLQTKTVDFKKLKSLHENELPESLREELGLLNETVKVKRWKKLNNAWVIINKDKQTIFKLILEDGGLKIYPKYCGDKAVMKGEISWFPLSKDDGKTEEIKINIIYIKLSFDKERFKYYPDTVQQYFKGKGGKNKKWGIFERTPFPHESTSDISYGKAQFKAYRDLGNYIVMENKNYFNSSN